jgi:ferredoxin--NADP+ reductase
VAHLENEPSVAPQEGGAPAATPPLRSGPPRTRPAACRVVDARQVAPTLVALRVARPEGLRFEPGHYGRLGLPVGSPDVVWRAYSFVSSPGEATLEFLVTTIPGGALSPRLAALVAGDAVVVDPVARGFFVERELAPGDALWMLATGSGVGPYVSMLRDGGVMRRWRHLVLVHSVRTAAELACGAELRALADAPGSPLRYLPVVTRESAGFPLAERIPALLGHGTLEAAAGLPLEPTRSRAMVCGNPDFTGEMRRLLASRGFTPCRRAARGTMLFEHYW